jgi:hypothetical protein
VTDARSSEAADAAQAIERVIWRNGITGDACARVAQSVLAALGDAGLVVLRRSDED